MCLCCDCVILGACAPCKCLRIVVYIFVFFFIHDVLSLILQNQPFCLTPRWRWLRQAVCICTWFYMKLLFSVSDNMCKRGRLFSFICGLAHDIRNQPLQQSVWIHRPHSGVLFTVYFSIAFLVSVFNLIVWIISKNIMKYAEGIISWEELKIWNKKEYDDRNKLASHQNVYGDFVLDHTRKLHRYNDEMRLCKRQSWGYAQHWSS